MLLLWKVTTPMNLAGSYAKHIIKNIQEVPTEELILQG